MDQLNRLITEVNIESILDMLAYIMARNGLDKEILADSLDLLMGEKTGWDIQNLVEQVTERAQVIAKLAEV